MKTLLQAFWLHVQLRFVVLLLQVHVLSHNVQDRAWWKEQYKFKNPAQLNRWFMGTFNIYLLALGCAYMYTAFVSYERFAGQAGVGYMLAAMYLFLSRSTQKRYDRYRKFSLILAEKADERIEGLKGEVRYWQVRSTMNKEV